jgi:hypothetical protein
LIELSGRYATAGENTRVLAAARDHVPGSGGENDGGGEPGAIATENETRTSDNPSTRLAPGAGETAVTRNGVLLGRSDVDVEVELAPDVRVVVVTPGEGAAVRLRWLTAKAATAPAATSTATATSKRSGVTVRVQRRCG